MASSKLLITSSFFFFFFMILYISTTTTTANAQISDWTSSSTAMSAAYPLDFQDLDSYEEEEEEEAIIDGGGGGGGRRSLYWKRLYYISYGALSANRVPCPPRSGRSYYTHNCYQARGPVRPYSRGCSCITRCRR